MPYAKFDKFNAATWQPRGFDWVDPKSDIEADIIAIDAGLKTRAEIAAERGKDLRDIFEQLSREKELADEYGLEFTSKEKSTKVKIEEIEEKIKEKIEEKTKKEEKKEENKEEEEK